MVCLGCSGHLGARDKCKSFTHLAVLGSHRKHVPYSPQRISTLTHPNLCHPEEWTGQMQQEAALQRSWCPSGPAQTPVTELQEGAQTPQNIACSHNSQGTGILVLQGVTELRLSALQSPARFLPVLCQEGRQAETGDEEGQAQVESVRVQLGGPVDHFLGLTDGRNLGSSE